MESNGEMKPRVLLVVREPTGGGRLIDALQYEFEVRRSLMTRDILAQCLKFGPALVIAEMSLEIGGESFVEAMRTIPDLDLIPLILITDIKSDLEKNRLIELGVHDFLRVNTPEKKILRQVKRVVALAHWIQRRALKSERLFQAVIDNANGVICVRDRAGRNIISNEYVERVLNLKRWEVIGQTVYDMYPIEYARVFRENDEAVWASKTLREYEEVSLLSDGIHHFQTLKFPIVDPSGNMEFLGTIATDVSDLVRAREDIGVLNLDLERRVAKRTQELERAQEQLLASEKMSVLGSLAAGLAHELNTPLGAIGSASNSLREFLNSELQTTLETVRGFQDESASLFLRCFAASSRQTSKALTAGDRKTRQRALADFRITRHADAEEMAELWSELGLAHERSLLHEVLQSQDALTILRMALQFAEINRISGIVTLSAEKIEHVVLALRTYLEGNFKEDAAEIKLRAEFESVLVLVRNRIPSLGVNVSLEIAPEFRLCGCGKRLSQVWTNLVNNALQAMEGGGALTIQASRSRGRVLVRVEDTGVGIPDEIKDKVFVPFFTTKRNNSGLGLGLDICKKIVESQSGTISFESRPGKTTFVVSLPDTSCPEADEAWNTL